MVKANKNPPSEDKTIGYWSVVSIGIGGMVGGGIFAVLGLSVQLAHGGAPIAFALAGVVALLTAYSYARLSVAFPTRGGTVEFLNQAFGSGILTGGLNVLLWISYIVMLSLYAYAFGSYGSTFFPEAMQPVGKHILITAAVILFTILNVLGAKKVGESERYIVATKIAILLVFLGVGLRSMSGHQLQLQDIGGSLPVIAGGMIIFLAYEGFELIANTAENVRNPTKMLPRAYYTSVGFVIALYVLIALVAVQNLPVKEIVAAKDYALAEAAKPFLGSKGFTMIAIAALLSTGSAINATLYGAARISYVIAKEGELPERLEEKIWNRPIEGLLITTGVTLLLANLVDLSRIAIMGSAGFLLIFAAVNISNARLSSITKSRKGVSILGAAVCLAALAVLISQRSMTSPGELWILAIMIGSAFLIESVYRRVTGRTIKSLYKRVR
jgi:amino acid transporter